MAIDVLSIITNGVLSSDTYNIIDPLGYYSILIGIEETIEEVPDYYIGGGGFSGGGKTRKRKKLKIKVVFNKNEKITNYENEVLLDDFNLKVNNVSFDSTINEIYITVSNPEIEKTKKILKINLFE